MLDQVNPNDYIITRKRKKYKFAKFANATNCFEFAHWQKRSVDAVEIGAGTGLFSVELASRHPNRFYVALDVKADRLQKGAYAAMERTVTNIAFVRARADQLSDCVPSNSVKRLWLTFADPFPKKRSSGRRMTHPTYLRRYADILSPRGALYIKHDNPTFFAWTLEQLVNEGWHIAELSFDLHDSELYEEYKVMTSYEARWLSEGRIVQFVKATPPRTPSGR